MTLGPAIDVTLGLLAVYLPVSILATAMQELVAGAFGWRAEMLSRKLGQIIRDPALQWEIEEHPLLAGLRGADGCPPSYIPPNCFAAAVFSIATAGRLETTPRERFDSICGWARDDGSPLAQVVLALAPDAGGDPARLGAALAQWYADAMDRLAGAYRRRAGRWALGLAIVAAAALNIDTLRLVAALAQGALGGGTLGQGTLGSVAALPIGWGGLGAVGLNDLPLAILGWCLTGLAASLVSGLWFDLIGRVVNLRHVGPRPAWPRRPAAMPATVVKLEDMGRARRMGSD
ncbi:hypothetical protein [Desertibaculum subflavum]|uniref:hypothetical protein n=1 Tax=Desertibaculum subflavum TaxID=2268458 RepID=UPI000E6679DA